MTSAPAASARTARVRAQLASYRPVDAADAALRESYLALVDDRGESADRRDGGPEHLTASCFVLSDDLTRVLLAFHRKGGWWVQLGGHVEPQDADLAAAALREAREEGGIDDVVLLTTAGEPVPADLHRHDLSASFGRCTAHWDTGWVALAPGDAEPRVSDESAAVAWWPVTDLPSPVPDDLPERLARALAVARG